MNKETQKIQIGENTYECNVDSKHLPALRRILVGESSYDKTIASLAVPLSPIWLNIVITILRLYRKTAPAKLRNRCVFEPSCSHYAELAFRNKGFIRGLFLTVYRLLRCRPGSGGVDCP